MREAGNAAAEPFGHIGQGTATTVPNETAASLNEPAAALPNAKAPGQANGDAHSTMPANAKTGAAQGTPDAAPGLCRCGAPAHAERAGRCAAGHVLPLNELAMLAGEHSVAFWAEHDAARSEIVQAVLSDAGHTKETAPRALLLAAETVAQSSIIRDSAYLRLAAEAGPLAASGRVRRSFDVWSAASDRVERGLRLLGLEPKAKRVPNLSDWIAEHTQEAPADGE